VVWYQPIVKNSTYLAGFGDLPTNMHVDGNSFCSCRAQTAPMSVRIVLEPLRPVRFGLYRELLLLVNHGATLTCFGHPKDRSAALLSL